MENFQKKKYHQQKKKIIRYSDVPALEKKLLQETPKKGDYLFDYKLKEMGADKDKMDQNELTKKYKINFKDLPISQNTVNGLNKRKFVKCSEIQRCTIPHALVGRDIMGASKTGSGKTLAYVIPLIERLYMQKFTEWDGLGALIILPTRELAMQVFEVVNSVNTFHELSVGLIIGGKNVAYEKENIHRMNILIATPGRLLQHMDETVGFNSENLKVLVIDEADMLFELGFAETLNAILDNIPKNRQTLLFSATLSKNVHQLGRLSLKQPEYIFLHDRQYNKNSENNENDDNQKDSKQKEGEGKQKIADIYETPFKLMQYYMPVNIEDKLNSLFSFLKAHQKSKVLVFFSTCKQVRFAYETFKKLKIGLPIMELHGRQKPTKRMALFYTFSEKKHAALFTTNLAARGLDFPAVNWVIQVDCPENTETYVHRIGRTARFKADGKALMMLTSQEEKMVEKLKKKNINLHKLMQNPQKALSITSTLQAFCSEDMDIKYLAQRAFISYMRSVYLNTGAENADIFDVHKIQIKELAESLGLVQTPIIKFKKNEEKQIQNSDSEEEEEDSDQEEKSKMEIEQQGNKKLSKLEKLKQKRQEERNNRKNKKMQRIDIMHMKDDQQEIEMQAYKEAQKIKPLQKHEKIQLKAAEKVQNLKQQKSFVDKDDSEGDEDSSDDEFLKKKVVQKPIKNVSQLEQESDSSEEDDEEEQKKQNKIKSTISKRQLKKIKMDGGVLGQQNKLRITDDGKYITQEEQKLQEMEQNRINLEKEESGMNLALKYALQKEQHEELDKKLHKDRLKEKIHRKKQKLLAKEFEKQGATAVFGGSDEENEDDESE